MEIPEFRINEKLIIFAPILIVVFIVLILFKPKQNSSDIFYNEIVPQQFDGIIVEKYHSSNHYDPVVKFNNGKNIEELDAFNWTNLYDECNVGDSIYKIKGDTALNLKLSRNDSIIRISYFFDSSWGIVKRKW
ncbi:MAG: hypothetical protein ACOYOT_01210 [Bacteroidales bacterium]